MLILAGNSLQKSRRDSMPVLPSHPFHLYPESFQLHHSSCTLSLSHIRMRHSSCTHSHAPLLMHTFVHTLPYTHTRIHTSTNAIPPAPFHLHSFHLRPFHIRHSSCTHSHALLRQYFSAVSSAFHSDSPRRPIPWQGPERDTAIRPLTPERFVPLWKVVSVDRSDWNKKNRVE